ncbi:MAG: zinc-ribbon domain-containing protein [Oscillospiraceae bacterium]|nr:zinc-ribbon domain-containing protein [Oscillospiraceae bacterium]
MNKYTGTKCIVCSEKFKDEDDVVVCPECGTPYHRSCYMKEGKCINESLHSKGESWVPEYDHSLKKEKEDTVCARCGYENSADDMFCDRCGFPLKSLEKHNEQMRAESSPLKDDGDPNKYNREHSGEIGIDIQPFLINFSDPLCGYNPDEDFDGVRLCELADYVESNTHYYLPIFKRIKELGKSFSWNFPAMLFPELYFANRKMPLAALAAWAAQLLTMIPLMIMVFHDADIPMIKELADNFDIRSSAFQTVRFLTYVLDYGIMFFCGAYANKLYYRTAVKRTASIKKSVPLTRLRQTLRSRGGTSVGWLIIFILLKLLPFFAVYALNFISVFNSMIK